MWGSVFKRLADIEIPADRMRATKMAVHPIEKRLGRKDPAAYESCLSVKEVFQVEDWQKTAIDNSEFSYDLDRIILNVWYEYHGGPYPSNPTLPLRHEVELLKATGLQNRKELSLPPLYYAARALKAQKERGGFANFSHTDIKAALTLVKELAEKFGVDDDESTRTILRSLTESPQST